MYLVTRTAKRALGFTTLKNETMRQNQCNISGHLFAALQSNGINAISTAKNTRRHKLHFRDRDLRHIDAYAGQGQLTQKTKMLVHLISACPGTASFVSNLLGTRTDNVGAKSLCVENDVPR